MDLCICFTWIVIACVIGFGSSFDGIEFCEHDTFKAECATGEVIVMTSAFYGILGVGVCINRDYGSTGCKTDKDAITFVDSRCSGLRNCSFQVSELFKLPSNCPKGLSRHLVASYQCVKVQTCESTCGHGSEMNIKLNAKSGILSNYASENGCNPCSWQINSKVGQMINFTAYSFGRSEGNSHRHNGGTSCYGDVALIKGTSSSNLKKLDFCESRDRMSSFRLKGGDNVEVKFLKLTNRQQDDRLLLKYQVVGCSDQIDNPPGTVVERKGITLKVKCIGSAPSWSLTCDGTSWVGEVGICDSNNPGNIDENEITSTFHHVTSSPSGMLIVVGIGLGIGIVLGMCLLTIVMVYMRRKRQQPYEYPTITPALHDQSTYCPYVEKPILIQESEYQCTHTRQTKCPHKRPDMKGFRPIPEGETVEDAFTEHMEEPIHVTDNTTIRPYTYERTFSEKDCKTFRQKNGQGK